MAWYRVYKTFKGGCSLVDYVEVVKYARKDHVEEVVRHWADNTTGGHNYGYRVYWSLVKRPSKKWLKNKIRQMKCTILSLNSRLGELVKLLGKA